MLIKPLAFAVLTTLLAFLSLGSFKSTAKAADVAMTRADFNYAYQAFQRSAKSKDEGKTFELALKALHIGESVFGEDSKTVATLTMNAALAYPTDSYSLPDTSAEPLMRKLVDRYLRLYGPDSVELGEPYTLLAESLYNHYREGASEAAAEINKLRGKVGSLAKRFPNELDWQSLLVRLIRLQTDKWSKKITQRMWESAKEDYGEDDELTLRWQYVLASRFMSDRKQRKAYLKLVDHPNLDPLLRFGLLQDLERHGPRKRRDEFRDRINHFTVQADTRYSALEMLPRYKVPPQYPKKALVHNLVGWLIVEFEVDERGRVVAPEIVGKCVRRLEQENCIEIYDDVFDREALRAVEEFLYVPRFVSGKPVKTQGVQNKLTWSLSL